MPRMIGIASLCLLTGIFGSSGALAQAQVQRLPPPALDLSASDIRTFIDALPKDRISDLPIRVTDVGGYKVGLYGVFRPRSAAQDVNRHETTVTEIYYMLEGTATLVTGGTVVDEKPAGTSPNTRRPNFRGTRIQGGVSRHVGPGDVIVIPGNLPHWWSSLDTDLRYLIFRPDPEGLQATK
jgi:mannose-6-phosphate isomerase-like protein (cupin superfamily)